MLSGIFFTLGALGRESASAWIVSMNASVCLKKQKYGKITVLGLSCYQENTHTCFPSFSWVLQPFYNSLDFVWDKLGEPVPEDTFTNSHLSWSSIIPICFLHLLRSTASSLLNSRAWQSFTTISLQVFFGLPLGLVPAISYSIYFFIKSLSSFRSTCSYHRNLFCCSNTEIMSSNPSLSLNLYLELYLVAWRHTSNWPFSSLPSEVPPHFPFLKARSHFHETYYFAHNCCTTYLLSSMIYTFW